MANPAIAERVGISGEECRKHLESLRTYRAQDSAGFTAKIQAIYAGRGFEPQTDPDLMLYSGGFFGKRDKQVMEQIRTHTADELTKGSFVFEDQRLAEMLFRYRARNYPDSLTPEELANWEELRFQWLTESESGGGYCMEEYQTDIEELMAGGSLSEAQQALMEKLLSYADTLLA
jgi:exodeoxyribonuclease-1